MLRTRALLILASAAIAGAGCSRYTRSSSGGDIFPKEDAAKTVVLHVQNLNPSPMELRTISNGGSLFVGSVGGQDSTDILLDHTLFPTASLFLTAIAADGHGRARVGPLSASKGDKILFTIQPSLDLSRAVVVR